MSISEVITKMQTALKGVAIRPVRETLLVENPQDLPRVMTFLKDHSDFRYDYLSSVTAVDYVEYLESVYHLFSIEKKSSELVVRTRVSRSNPSVPSLCSIYRSAEFQERENYDMYGIVYENHPDLRRIFMWEGFDGYPMRKDYIQEDSETLEEEDVQWLQAQGIETPDHCKVQKSENPQPPSEPS